MYNGNYVRSYERALSHVVPHHRAITNNRDGSTHPSSWIIASIDNQKFLSSLALGEEYIIRGNVIPAKLEDGEGEGLRQQHDPVTKEEVWHLEIATRRDCEGGVDDDDDASWKIHNSASVTLINTLHPSSPFPSSMSSSLNEKQESNTDDESAVNSNNNRSKYQQKNGRGDGDVNSDVGTIFEQCFTAYHDEFDTHYFYHHLSSTTSSSSPPFYRPHSILPIRNAMNFFERSRTNYLGGPNRLRKMQLEEDIIWVVTNIDDGKLMALPDIEDDDAFPSSNLVNEVEKGMLGENGSSASTTPSAVTATVALAEEKSAVDTSTFYWQAATPAPSTRREMTVRTNFIVKRRGMIVECRHELYMDDDGDNSSSDNDVGHRQSSNENDGNNWLEKNGRKRTLLAKATVTVMALKGSTRRPTSKLPQWILDQIMMGSSTMR